MLQPRIDGGWERLLLSIDFFLDGAQPIDVSFVITTAFLVSNDGEAFTQCVPKISDHVGFGGLETAAPCMTNCVVHGRIQRRASASNWRFASSQSDSVSPGKANLRRRSEMK